MGLDIFTLGSSKTYTKESLLGGGAVVGKNVTISSIAPIDGGNRVTFSYTLDNGTVNTSTMDVMDGKDGVDGLPGKDGKDGEKGLDGVGISKIEKIGTVDLVDTYRITFTDGSTFDYEVKNGADGQGTSDGVYTGVTEPTDENVTVWINPEGITSDTGASTWSEISDKPFETLSADFSVENGELKVVGGTGGSGEENKIEVIKVNGVEQAISADKSVDITVPTVTNDLTDELKTAYDEAVTAKHTHENADVLDGITAEKIAAWDKAEENIQSDWEETDETADGFIKNKPTIPSKISELDNDSKYQTAEQVNSTVTTEIAKVIADAPEDLNTLKEMSDWIAGHEDDATAMNSAIQKNKTDIETLQNGKADASDLTAHTGDTQNPHSVTKEQVGLENVDNTSDVDKPISTAQQEEFDKINGNLIEQKMLGWTVPKECPIQNYVGSDGVFHQRVGRVDLGSLDWEPYETTTSGKYRMGSSGISTLVKKPSSNATKFNGYSSKYSVITSDNAYAGISGIGVASTTGNVYVYDENYTARDDTSTFKSAMSGVYLYYELETEKTISVDGNEAVVGAVNEVNEKFNSYQKNLSINIFTGNIDEIGTESGLPETSSRCWCQASKVTGTLPFTTVNASNMYFLLMTDVATNSGSTSIRTQKAIVFRNGLEEIYERLFVNLKWKDWQKTNRDETKTTSISLPYGLSCSISYNSNNVHMKIIGTLTSDIDVSGDYVTIGTISDDNLKPKLDYQEYKLFTSSKLAQVIISRNGEIKVGYGHTLIDYSNVGLVTGESVLAEMNYIV